MYCEMASVFNILAVRKLAEPGRNLEILAEFAGGSTSVCKYRSVGLSLICRFVVLFYVFIAKC